MCRNLLLTLAGVFDQIVAHTAAEGPQSRGFLTLRPDLAAVLMRLLRASKHSQLSTHCVVKFLATLILLTTGQTGSTDLPNDYPDTVTVVLSEGILPVRPPWSSAAGLVPLSVQAQ